MECQFEYGEIISSLGDLTVKDIQNCYLEAYDDLYYRSVLWIKTSDDAETKILIASNLKDDPDEFKLQTKRSSSISYQHSYDLNDTKVEKLILSWLRSNKQFTQVIDKQEEYSEEEKIEKLYNILSLMENK